MKKLSAITFILFSTLCLFAGKTVTDNVEVKANGTIKLEGATNDNFETTLTVTDPTADRTITFKDESGTVAYLSDVAGGGVGGCGTGQTIPLWTGCGSSSCLGDSAITQTAFNTVSIPKLEFNSLTNYVQRVSGNNTDFYANNQHKLRISGGFEAVEMIQGGRVHDLYTFDIYDGAMIGYFDSCTGYSLELRRTDPVVGSTKQIRINDVAGYMGITNCTTANNLTMTTATCGELVDSMFSQNGGGTLGSVDCNGFEVGYIQSGATSQNYIDLRNSNQYTFRVGNNNTYTFLQNQANMSAASCNSFILQLVGVGASDRPELVFSKNDNSWQSRIKSDDLSDVRNHYLSDVSGRIAIDNSLTSCMTPMATSTDGELIDATALSAVERSADPSNPAEGKFIIWMSDGTGSGDDGDIMIKITAGATTKTGTLVDFSTL